MRVVSLHPDVLVATSRIWQTTCTLVRGAAGAAAIDPDSPLTVLPAGRSSASAETFVIDSPILPDELEILPAVLEQARFPAPSGLLATHADWDHLLGRLAFPQTTMGAAQTSVERMRSAPGEAQRELRSFDEEHYVERARPLSLGSVQALDVPGRCEIGGQEIDLHLAAGHTGDGMALWIDWAGVLIAGDYLSTVEIPVLGEQGSVDAYLTTLERLRPLITTAEHVVPGHGPVLDVERATAVLEEDLAYLCSLRDSGSADLPQGRRTRAQRRIHSENVDRVAG